MLSSSSLHIHGLAIPLGPQLLRRLIIWSEHRVIQKWNEFFFNTGLSKIKVAYSFSICLNQQQFRPPPTNLSTDDSTALQSRLQSYAVIFLKDMYKVQIFSMQDHAVLYYVARKTKVLHLIS